MAFGDTGGVPATPSDEKKKRVKKYAILFLILLLLVGGVFFAFERLGWLSHTPGPTQAAPIRMSGINIPTPPREESVAETIAESEAPYRSENFRAGSIAIGGEAELMIPENDPTPLEIGSVRGEAFTEKGKNTSKLVITWETNKPAKSEIAYGKGVGQTEGLIAEESYGLTHSVVISDLSQSSTYVYVITARDQYGNEASSEPYAVYTGAREVSLFELMAGAIGDVFGWAVKK